MNNKNTKNKLDYSTGMVEQNPKEIIACKKVVRTNWLIWDPNYQNPKLESEPDELFKTLLTRKQVKEILSCSYVSLHNYKKRGVLIPVKIQGKVYYKREDIINLINKNTLEL